MVSVIVPVYNAEKYLEKTIDSILSQTYTDFELILVNDGSTDCSNQIIKKYVELDCRIKHVDGDNYGAPHARNVGIEIATGDYVVFFDADDTMNENALEELYHLITHEQADMVIGSRTHIDENGVEIKRIVEKAAKYSLPRDYDKIMYIDQLPDNKMFRMSIIKQYRIRFSNLRIGQDLNFVLKYLSVSKLVAVTDSIVCNYRLVVGSISRTATEKVLDIVNSFNDAVEFAIHNNAANNYFAILDDIRILHYTTQFSKYTFASNSKTREKIFYTMYSEIQNTNKRLNGVMSTAAAEKLEYVERKYRYRIITLSNIYCKIRQAKYKKVF